MVRAADDLKRPIAGAAGAGVRVDLTGSAGMWSDFNEANKSAMLRSEVISWPVTLAILLLAFGSLVAAGLPLMLTILGLVSAAGIAVSRSAAVRHFDLGDELCADVRARSRHRLCALRRRPLPQAHVDDGLGPVEAVGRAMDTAGKAVLFSGVTVLVALSAVLLVPSPAFRSMALGIMLAVSFVLAASLTLLPAVLAKLGGRVNRLALPWARRGGGRSPRFGRLGCHGVAAPACLGARGPAGRGCARMARSPTRHRDALDHRRTRGGQLAAGL